MRKEIVTGGSRGIGLELAKRLAAENYQVTILERSEGTLNEALQQIMGQINPEMYCQ